MTRLPQRPGVTAAVLAGGGEVAALAHQFGTFLRKTSPDGQRLATEPGGQRGARRHVQFACPGQPEQQRA